MIDMKYGVLKYFYFWNCRVGKWTKYNRQLSHKKLKESKNESSVACTSEAKFRGMEKIRRVGKITSDSLFKSTPHI